MKVENELIEDTLKEPEVSRRNVAALVLGAIGATALSACAQEGGAVFESVGVTSQAVTGSSLYFDTMYGPVPNLSTSGGSGAYGQVAVVGGFSVPGDGGGGTFVYVLTTSTPADGGTVVQAPGGFWLRVFSGALNVKWFGAKGDEVADDTLAIQAAINVATNYSTHAQKSGTVFFPIGNYKITSTLTYIGEGFAIGLIGELGGTFINATSVMGSKLAWYGPSSGSMLELRSVWRGSFENLNFDGRFIVPTCVWLRSNQAQGGAGTDGCVFRRCSFENVASGTLVSTGWGATTVTTSVAFKVGDSSGGTYQADLTTWEDCSFDGSSQSPGAVTCWRQEQPGNTCCFWFTRCNFVHALYGVDALQVSNTLSVDSCVFGSINQAQPGDAPDSSACLRVGGGARIVVRGCAVQNSGLARFVHCPGMGTGAGAGLKVEDCFVLMNSTADNVIIRYDGQLTLINNTFMAATTNLTTSFFKIVCGTPLLNNQAVGTVPGSVISLNNSYGRLANGSYAPLYDTSNNALTGPASLTYYGLQRCSVWSMGDMASTPDVSGVTVHLQPWFGAMPNGGATATLAWTPVPVAGLPNLAAVSVSETYPVAATVNSGDVVTVSFSLPLPPGVMLTAAVSGPNAVSATLLNMSGATLTRAMLGNGTLYFTVSPRV